MTESIDTRILEGFLDTFLVDYESHPLAPIAADFESWGKMWTPKENSIMSWSIQPKDRTHFYFYQQYGSHGPFLPLCNNAYISLVTSEDSYLLVKFETSEVSNYIFTIVFPPNEVRFSHSFVHDYLVGKAEQSQIHHLETKLLPVLSSPKAFVRSYSPYTAQIWKALSDYDAGRKGKAPSKRPGSLALQARSTSGTARSGLGTPGAAPGCPSKKRPNLEACSSGSKRSKGSMGDSALTSVYPTMMAAVSEKDIDYNEARKSLQKYWEECADCYILGRDNPVDVDIDLLDRSEARYIVRELEASGVAHYKNILTHAVDVSSRQTICIMPILEEAPEKWDWEALRSSCRFRVIDGQHHVEAAKELIRDRKVDDAKIKALRTWKAHVVWHSSANAISTISAMANVSNSAGTFTPSWATNIMGARSVWVDYGRPLKVKKPHGRESDEEKKNRRDYEVRIGAAWQPMIPLLGIWFFISALRLWLV
jgi:hypothetical protein